MKSQEVKTLLLDLGADLCGIAGVDRFADAPEGFHPRDVLPGCRSVVSFACRFPAGTLRCASPVPYTRVRNTITAKLDAIALDACMELERRGVTTVPIPTNESLLDERTGRYRGAVSQKHAAQAAGLGTIGRHSLLITPRLGSMVWLGMLLTEAALEPDPLLEPVCNGCGLCVEACPVRALDGELLCQRTCWDHAFVTEHENWRIRCHACRDVCPYNLGADRAAWK